MSIIAIMDTLTLSMLRKVSAQRDQRKAAETGRLRGNITSSNSALTIGKHR